MKADGFTNPTAPAGSQQLSTSSFKINPINGASIVKAPNGKNSDEIDSMTSCIIGTTLDSNSDVQVLASPLIKGKGRSR